MKKIVNVGIVIFMILMVGFSFSGCANTKNVVTTNEVSENTGKSGTNIKEYPVTIRRSDYMQGANEMKSKVLITTYDEFVEYCENFDYKDSRVDNRTKNELLSEYNEEFFKTKSLAMEYVELSSSCEKIELNGAIKNENFVEIKYDIVSEGEVGLCVMCPNLIIAEVDKDITGIQ